MKIEREDLEWAVRENLLSAETAEQLWQAWLERKRNVPQFNFANVAYYFGALIIILSLGKIWAVGAFLSWQVFIYSSL